MAQESNKKEQATDVYNVLAAGTYQIGIKTSDFRGDHAADIFVALNIPSTMTIGELVELVFEKREIHNASKVTDHIEIRACS